MRGPRAGDGKGRLLALSVLAARHCVEVELTSALTVGALRGGGLSWRGLTASVSSSPLYDDTRSISAAIHSEAAALAGIEYRCRHDDDEIAYAMFDRARPHLSVVAESAVSCVEIAFSLHGHHPFVEVHDGGPFGILMSWPHREAFVGGLAGMSEYNFSRHDPAFPALLRGEPFYWANQTITVARVDARMSEEP